MERAAERAADGSQDPGRTANLFVFMGTKGGCGTTTLAANFALALAQELKAKLC